MLKGLWLWNDPERKIILSNMLEREKKPLRDFIYELEENKKMLTIISEGYIKDIKRLKKLKQSNQELQILEIESLLEDLKEDLYENRKLLEERTKLYNNVLGEKRGLENEIRMFKQKAYEAILRSKRYIIETSPINDILDGNMYKGKMYFTNSQTGVEKILQSKFRQKEITPIGSEESYEIKGMNKIFRKIVDADNNPMKGRGFQYEGNINNKPKRIIVRENTKINDDEIKKSSFFGREIESKDIEFELPKIENNRKTNDDLLDEFMYNDTEKYF